jgi:DNA-binding response OmpR family regulator
VDDEVFGAPRHALVSAAQLARQRRAVVHGPAPVPPATLELGQVIFSSAACSLRSPTGRVPLSRTERDILTRLAADRGVPVRSEVLADAARIRMFPSSRYLGSVIVSLRKKLRRLGVDAGTLATVHGVGYVLLTPEQLRQDAP